MSRSNTSLPDHGRMRRKPVFRSWLLPAMALALLGGMVSLDALGQTYSISQLSDTIRSIERNRDFKNLAANTQNANAIGAELQNLEGTFRSNGCQAALERGERLNRDCRNLARSIIRGRRELALVQEKVVTGQALARQREQFAQQLASQRDTNSRAGIITEQRSPNFFEQLFGGLGNSTFGSGEIIDGEFGEFGAFNTVRTVCVRKNDGYYWPVSFSTLPEYLENDAIQCRRQCPGKEVDLYYYSNPGGEPKEMVNLAGQRYAALPTAFAYRQQFSVENSCKAKVTYGTVEIMTTDAGTRTFISIDDRTVALPLRDPRRQVQAVAAADAEIIRVPLPRPRPDAQGLPTGTTQVLSADLRLVEINGRVVRIVGPDTPYAQLTAAGS